MTTPSRTARPSGLKNVLANWGAFVANAALAFVLAPFVVHRLGNNAYGVWVLLGSLVGYLGFLDIGVRGAVTRYVANLYAAGDDGGAARLVSAAFRIFLGLGTVAISIALGIALVVGHVFNVPPDMITVARWVVIISGVNVAVSLIGGVFGGVVAGLERFDITSGVDVVVNILRSIAVVVALSLGHGLLLLAVIQLSSSLLTATANFTAGRRLYPELRMHLGLGGRAEIRTLFAFSIFSSFLQFSGLIIYYSDALVIGAFLPVGMVTFYAVAGNLITYTRQVVSSITHIVTSRASALQAVGPSGSVANTMLLAVRGATVVSLPIVITFLLRGGTFLSLWMGPEFEGPSGQVLFILGLGVSVGSARAVVVALFQGINEHRRLVPVVVGEAVLNLVLSIWWVRSYGLPGVAWGTVVPNAVVSVGIVPFYARRVLAVPWTTFFAAAWLRPLLACAPFTLAVWLMERYWPTPNLAAFFGQTALALPLVLAGALAAALTKAERAQYLRRSSNGLASLRSLFRAAGS